MDCPNCGVYNPEDRQVCWRCDQELPTPKEPKKKRADPSTARRRMWIIVGIALLLWALLTWILPRILSILMGGAVTPVP
jgi:predicted nucleic acid-binding Zn ribbon protein